MSAGMDDQKLRQYLLGQLTPAAREEVVERLTRDEQYFDAAEAIEAELRDAFVRGELAPRDREDFERSLQRTPRQQEETVLAGHLTEVLDRPQPRAAAPVPIRVWLSAAAGVGALAIILWQGVENRQLRSELDVARRAPASAPPAGSPAPEVASLYLPGMVLRGAEAAPELVLKPGAQLVRLEADRESQGALQAELENAAGVRVWSQSLDAATASQVRIWLPADVLAAGTYTLRLRASAPAPVSPREVVYRFRVSRAGVQRPSTTKPAQ